ncbi:MAG TPA: hypothetical protein VGD80_28875, partial [Kofleriaceae bacterium]
MRSRRWLHATAGTAAAVALTQIPGVLGGSTPGCVPLAGAQGRPAPKASPGTPAKRPPTAPI